MYIGSFGHEHIELRLKSTDVYIDIRDDAPVYDSKKLGMNRAIQKQYLEKEGVKAYYKKNIYEKILVKIQQRKTTSFRVFIGDDHGKYASVVFVEKLERDLLKKKKIYSTIEHITITA